MEGLKAISRNEQVPVGTSTEGHSFIGSKKDEGHMLGFRVQTSAYGVLKQSRYNGAQA